MDLCAICTFVLVLEYNTYKFGVLEFIFTESIVHHTRESDIPNFSLSSAGIEACVITLL